MNRFLLNFNAWKEIIKKVNDPYVQEGEVDFRLIDPFQTETDSPSLEDFFGIVLENFWNASVQELYDDWNTLFNTSSDDSINTKSKYFSKGDAGYDFVNHFIYPWRGINRDTYEPDYRGAAEDSQNLQFTNEKSSLEGENFYYRLLMPKNTRRVQAEDLTRNFYVISGVLTGLVDFLFTDNSPMLKLQNEILNEIRQLWENVLYLWFIFKLLNEPRISKDYHIEFVPIDKDTLNKRRFDNWKSSYDEGKDEAVILDKLKDYYYKYPESNLLLIPYVRSSAFYRNYHEEVEFPFLCFYLRKKAPLLQNGNEWENADCRIIKKFSKKLSIKISDYIDNLVAIREKGMFLKLGRPLSSIDTYEEEEQGIYYGQLRIVPTITQTLNTDMGKITFSFSFSVYDVGEYYHSGGNSIENENNLLDNITFSYEEDSSGNIEWISKRAEQKEKLPFYNYPRQLLGAYKGETLTLIKQSIERIPYIAGKETNIQILGDLFKIGNYLPYQNPNAFVDVKVSGNYTSREQINNNHTHTNYLANLTIGGIDSTVTTTMGISSSSPAKTSNCKFYIPTQRSQSKQASWYWGDTKENTAFYWQHSTANENMAVNESYLSSLLQSNTNEKNVYQTSEITKATIPYIGVATLRRILTHTTYLNYLRKRGVIEWGNLNKPVLFIGACGIKPWGGNKASSGTGWQMYWIRNLLQGLYLFLPMDFVDATLDAKYPTHTEIKGKGKIYFLYEINKTEYNFTADGKNYFKVDGTRWRLPRVIGNYDSNVHYLTVYKKNDTDNIAGVIKLSNDEYERYQQECDTQEKKNAYVTEYIANEPLSLLTEQQAIEEKIAEITSKQTGIWRVYDGNVSKSDGNKANYLTYRQVVEGTFEGDTKAEKIFLKEASARALNVNNWTSASQNLLNEIWSSSYTMPDSGAYNFD